MDIQRTIVTLDEDGVELGERFIDKIRVLHSSLSDDDDNDSDINEEKEVADEEEEEEGGDEDSEVDSVSEELITQAFMTKTKDTPTSTPTLTPTSTTLSLKKGLDVEKAKHTQSRRRRRDALTQVDEKTSVGNSVCTPNYLRYTKMLPIWKAVFREELNKTIQERGKHLLRGGFISTHLIGPPPNTTVETRNEKEHNDNRDDDSTIDENLTRQSPDEVGKFIAFDSNVQMIPSRLPKIEKAAKNYLYKSLNVVGLKVLLGYNKHCRRSGCKIINQSTVTKQWISTHGYKKSMRMIQSFRNRTPPSRRPKRTTTFKRKTTAEHLSTQSIV